MLKSIAQKLEMRARSDVSGGWSTNHTQPMKDLAEEIFAHLGRGGSDRDLVLIKRVALKLDQFAKEVVGGGWSTQNHSFFQEESLKLFAVLGRV